MLDDFKVDLDDIRRQNESDPSVETADPVLFDKMKQELQELKDKIAQQKRDMDSKASTADYNSSYSSGSSSSNYSPSSSQSSKNMAMTNSGGGSLSIRTEPDMGAATLPVRIADNSLVEIIERSNKTVRLDGKDVRFVKVAVKGYSGWVLESYLNFN